MYMSVVFRLLLLVMAFITLFYMIYKIRKSRMMVGYAVFWVVFSLALIVMALFPQLCEWIARLLGVQSPANLVFAFIIFILLIRLFAVSAELSTLESKLKELSQNIALKEAEREEK